MGSTAIIASSPLWGLVDELTVRVARVVGVFRPYSIGRKRIEALERMLSARSSADLDAIVLEYQQRWRREAIVWGVPALAVRRVSRFLRRDARTQALSEVGASVDSLLALLDERVVEEHRVAAEMIRVALLSALHTAQVFHDYETRSKRAALPNISFFQLADMVQTTGMFAVAAMVGATRSEPRASVEIVEELARRVLDASDRFAGFVGQTTSELVT